MATLPNPLPKLATDPSGRSLGLQLPPGRLVDLTEDGPWHEPLLWHAEKPAAPGTWKALGAPAARAGLLPVLVDVGGGQGGPADWELMPRLMSYPGDHDAEDVLADYWEDWTQEGWGEEVEPFGAAWPGLAPAPAPTAVPDARAAQVADSLTDAASPWFRDARLALVPARRSADIPAAIGWAGPLNHDNDVARPCAVLRSWEDRFGVRVVGLGFDTLALSVAAPPSTREDAEAVAAEHFAFCPDNITQGSGSLRDYAEGLVGTHTWTFWWD
ncbi:hypothetical protein AQI95_06595 [Streptomyces yokosukanensis]|uniref:DUF4253 domain-containing protein n=1 Tax=Streptomyces yokosukanensis TaxID=67386 RepID=A0A101PBY5_9ACTN|nr:DUF4253 domain-containing protein [Streptomyces yokosukanensis]KUN08691.1 hypothetical protein AQI95_06595 [Streptomyces yokosukanensis]